jgi:hypothetical protein
MADAAAKDAVSRAHKEGLETLKHIRNRNHSLVGCICINGSLFRDYG